MPDNLNFFRGLVNALPIALLLWIAIIAAVEALLK